MKKLILFFSILLLPAVVFAQVENYTRVPITKVRFYQDFLCFYAENGKTRLDVFIQVPYYGVQFIKTGEGFEAAYSVTVSVYDEDKDNLISEKIWNEKIVAISFGQTQSEDNFNLSLRSFELLPGKYFIKTTLTDKDSKSDISTENQFTVKDLNKKPAISDLMLIARKTVVEGTNKIIPNVSGNIITEKEGLPVFFEVYSDSAAEFKIEYDIKDESQKVIYKVDQTQTLKPGSNQIFYTVDSMTLGLGKYVFTAQIKTDGNILDSTSKTFVSRWVGVPSSITDLNKAVDQLVYIANPDEVDYINESLTNEEKAKRFVDFWKKRDPNPDDEFNPVFNEYYNRVAYSNENFTSYSIEGWRSDRGMVLIILGIPDNIDRHPFEYYSKPYEIWQYYDLNRSFVFIDNTGFGDYRLSPDTPLYGDLYRFRY